MTKPQGDLPQAQFEIMNVLWQAEQALTVTEVQTELKQIRELARNTVLTQLDRLADRNWIIKKKIDGRMQYAPAISKEEGTQQLADSFTSQFFGGSPSALLKSLLGGKQDEAIDFNQLREMISKAEAEQKDGQSS